MFLPTPLMAEISDKMMSWPALVVLAVGLSVAAWLLSRKGKWLVLIPLPLALWLAAGAIEEIRDASLAPAVIQELGYSYWVTSFVPLVAVVVAAGASKKTPIQFREPAPGLARGRGSM